MGMGGLGRGVVRAGVREEILNVLAADFLAHPNRICDSLFIPSAKEAAKGRALPATGSQP